MKKLLILFLLLGTGIEPSLATTTDTIDHWIVYLNNKKIHGYTQPLMFFTMKMK